MLRAVSTSMELRRPQRCQRGCGCGRSSGLLLMALLERLQPLRCDRRFPACARSGFLSNHMDFVTSVKSAMVRH